MTRIVHLVQQTHWDREWYFSREDSNVLLYNEIERITKILKDTEQTYILDGQTVLIDEYYRLYDNSKVKKLIAEKKLFTGPWYTQTDTLLASKEAIIRNLYYGIKGAREYGHSMNVGYIPDAFGQNSYLPAIFKGCGIENAMFQRGLYDDQIENHPNFNWVAPDGSRIKTHNMIHGYAVFGNYELNDEFIEKRAIPALDELERYTPKSQPLLIPCGWDQTSISENFQEFVDYLNKKLPQYKFINSDYERFMEELEIDNNHTVSGELRATQRSRTHRTIGSSRYDIKLLVDNIDYKLLRQLEPLYVIYSKFNTIDIQPQINQLWKQLFDCHAHDSLGGCNSDDTNSSIIERLKSVIRTIDSLLNLMKKQIALAIQNHYQEEVLILFNLDTVNQNMFENVVIYSHQPNVEITTTDKRNVEFKIVSVTAEEAGTKLKMIDGVQVEIPEKNYYRIVANIKTSVDQLGFETLLISESTPEENYVEQTSSLENKYLKVECIDELLVIYDKVTKERTQVMLVYESDNGDTYDFDPVEGSQMNINNFSLIYDSSSLEANMLIFEAKLSEELTEYKIKLKVELFNDNRLRFKLSINNQRMNHRLSLKFKTEEIIKLYTGNGYELQVQKNDYKYLANWKINKFAECPVNIFNFEKFAAIETISNNYNIITCGCKEISFDKESFIVTLYRAVGRLGKSNLTNRPGRASGINNKTIYTPMSQLQGELCFQVELVIGGGVESIFNQYNRAYPLQESYHLQTIDYFENRIDRFYVSAIEGDIDSRCKVLHHPITTGQTSMIRGDEKYIYIRKFNPTEIVMKLTTNEKKIQQVNLIDELQPKIDHIPAKGFITFRVNKEEM